MRKSDERKCECRGCHCDKIISRRRSTHMCSFCENGIHRNGEGN